MLCGPPGSGKGVVSRSAAARGMVVLSLGDVVRAEVAARGLDESPENVGSTALSMRCLLYTSPSPRDRQKSRMPSSA